MAPKRRAPWVSVLASTDPDGASTWQHCGSWASTRSKVPKVREAHAGAIRLRASPNVRDPAEVEVCGGRKESGDDAPHPRWRSIPCDRRLSSPTPAGSGHIELDGEELLVRALRHSMKQLVQSPKTGKLALVDVPTPVPEAPGQVLVRNRFSVVSRRHGEASRSWTSRGSRSSSKARSSRPDLVRAGAAASCSEEGPLAHLPHAVMSRLDVPAGRSGYSCAGVVEAVGFGVTRFAAGRSRGLRGRRLRESRGVRDGSREPGGSLCARGASTARARPPSRRIGAIAIQGIRVAAARRSGRWPRSMGLGLIGQLTRSSSWCANGCRVLGHRSSSPRRASRSPSSRVRTGPT